MFKTLELPGFAPLAPYQDFALDPLGALSGLQSPRPIILHPPFLIPGYGPVIRNIHFSKKEIMKSLLS